MLESIVAFWLLAVAAVLAQEIREALPVGRRLRRLLRAAVVAVLGTGLLYLLIALRIYSLVVLGTHVSPKVCVSLAHSRLGGLLFLGVSAALVAAACPGTLGRMKEDG